MPTATAILKIARLNTQTGGQHPPFHLDHRHSRAPRINRAPKSNKPGVPRYVKDGSGNPILVID